MFICLFSHYSSIFNTCFILGMRFKLVIGKRNKLDKCPVLMEPLGNIKDSQQVNERIVIIEKLHAEMQR